MRHQIVAYDFGMKETSCAASPGRFQSASRAGDCNCGRSDSIEARWRFSLEWPRRSLGLALRLRNVRDLIGQIPIFGICLGHQMLGFAIGGKTFKLSSVIAAAISR